MKKSILFSLALLLSFSCLWAQEVIVDNSNDSVVILNNELRKLRNDVRSLQNTTTVLNSSTNSNFAQALGSASSPTTTSTSFVELDDMNTTLTLSAANKCLVLFTGPFSIGAAGSINFILAIDTVTVAATQYNIDFAGTGDTELGQLAYITASALTKGNHTFTMQWKVSAGDTATADATSRSLQVIELN